MEAVATEVSRPVGFKWRGFDYKAVPELQAKINLRRIRTARKNMIKFFLDGGFYDFADRLRRLRANPALDGWTKRTQFERILQDYASTVTQQREAAQPAPEAAPSPEVGVPMGVPSV